MSVSSGEVSRAGGGVVASFGCYAAVVACPGQGTVEQTVRLTSALLLLWLATSVAMAAGDTWDITSQSTGTLYSGVLLGTTPCASGSSLQWFQTFTGGSGTMVTCTGDGSPSMSFTTRASGIDYPYVASVVGGGGAGGGGSVDLNWSKTSHVLQAVVVASCMFAFMLGYRAGDKL